MIALLERLMLRVEQIPIAGCWIWMGALRNGYGAIGLSGRTEYVHRLMFVLHYGELGDGFEVCHSCDVRPCVNPSHMFRGTRSDNMRDAFAKGRTRGTFVSMPGESNKNAKLTDELVLEIRQSKCTQRALAARFGVSKTTIAYARNGKSWGHV